MAVLDDVDASADGGQDLHLQVLVLEVERLPGHGRGLVADAVGHRVRVHAPRGALVDALLEEERVAVGLGHGSGG